MLKLLEQKGDAKLLIINKTFLLGKIKVIDTPYTVIIGPTPIFMPKRQDLLEIMIDDDISLDDYNAITEHYKSTKFIGVEYFLAMLASFYLSLNHQNISTDDFLFEDQDFQKIKQLSELKLLRNQEDSLDQNRSKLQTHNYEKRLTYLIEQGDIEGMKSLSKNIYPGEYTPLADDLLRSYKIAVMTLNTLSSRAAIKGGLNIELVYTVSDTFAQMVEKTKTMDELSKLSRNIRMTYCERVAEVRHTRVNDASIRSCLTFIHENINRKLSADEIAQFAGFSKEYLSAKFKKVMGCNLSEYIMKEKIDEAKKLLIFSEKSLSEISYFLSFSSQSYFNNLFKRFVRITPNDFRNQHRSDDYQEKSKI